MTDAVRISGWAITGLILALICLAVFILAGPVNHSGLLNFMTVFKILGLAILGSVISLIICIVGIVVSRQGNGMTMSIVGLLASIAVIGSLVVIILGAGKAPAMNDYTTDTKNPPMFSQKILDARKTTAMVPAEYAGPAATAMQVKAFPEIKTLSFTGSTDEVFDRALDNAKKMKWVIVDSDKAAGMIEATATTGWFGFKDDIAIRITKTATGCNFDMRSVSRVGKGDMGTNAKRIRTFSKLMGSM